MKKVALSKLKTAVGRYVRKAGKEEVVITRRGKPVGVLIGFDTDEDWLDYLLESSPVFVERIAKARQDLREGRGKRLEDVDCFRRLNTPNCK